MRNRRLSIAVLIILFLTSRALVAKDDSCDICVVESLLGKGFASVIKVKGTIERNEMNGEYPPRSAEYYIRVSQVESMSVTNNCIKLPVMVYSKDVGVDLLKLHKSKMAVEFMGYESFYVSGTPSQALKYLGFVDDLSWGVRNYFMIIEGVGPRI